MSGAKGVEKESKKLQDHILDIAGPLCMSFEHVSSWQEGGEEEAGSITFFKWNLWRTKCCVASCACLLPVLPPSSNFHVAESRLRFCFLQHENLLCAEMAIRAEIIGTCNAIFVAPPVARKYCPYSPLQKLWGDWYE